MAVWRLQTSTSKGNIAEYCLDKQIAAIGWGLKEGINHISQMDRESIAEDLLGLCLY